MGTEQRISIASLMMAAVAGTAGGAVIDTTYIGPASGDWNIAGNWDGGVIPNNGGGDTYRVFITAGGSAANVSNTTLRTIDRLEVDAGSSVTIANGGDLRIDGAGDGVIDNAGTITIGSAAANTYLRLANGPIMLTGGGVVEGTDAATNWLQDVGGGALVNVNNTIRGSMNLGANSIPITNGGTIEATNAANPIVVDPDTTGATNTGTMRAASGAELRLLPSVYDNTGGLIEAADGGVVNVTTGTTIAGGSVTTSGSGEISNSGGFARLDGSVDAVTNNGTVRSVNGGEFRLQGSIINNGTFMIDSIGGNTYLRVENGETVLSGGGLIEASDSGTNWIYNAGGNGWLNNVDNTIRGAVNIGFNNMQITNGGLIEATGTVNPLVLDPDVNGLLNTGTLRARSGSVLRLNAGDYFNAGGVIEAEDNATVVAITGSAIVGGPLMTSGTGEIMNAGGFARLDGTVDAVINNGTIRAANGGEFRVQGTLVNNGTVMLDSVAANTYFRVENGEAMLTGGGVVEGSDSGTNWIYDGGFEGSLNNVDNTIRGAINIGFNTMAITNSGVMEASAATNAMVLDPDGGGMLNTGTLRAKSGSVLQMNAGAYTNTDGLIEAEDGATVRLISGAQILGGPLQSAGTGEFVNLGGFVVLNGSVDPVTIMGTVRAANGGEVRLEGSIINEGTMRLDSSGGNTYMRVQNGEVTLTGGGDIIASDAGTNWIYDAGGAGDVNNVDNTITGAVNIGFNTSKVTNGGTIDATAAVNKIVIDPDGNGLANTGTLRASGAAGMTIAAGPMTTSGTVEVLSSSVLTRTGDYLQTGGVTDVEGLLDISTALLLEGGVVSGTGMIDGDLEASSGDVKPAGDGIGTLTLLADATPVDDAFASFDLASTTPDTGHDVLSIIGTLNAGGALRATLADGYVPAVGSSFDVINAGSIDGTYGCFDLEDPTTKTSFRVEYGPDFVRLVVTDQAPEPGDINRDGGVGFADLTILLGDWGPCTTTCCPGDLNGDLVTGFADLTLLLGAWSS